MQIYQDIWVNGVVQTKGIRDCASRYQPIEDLARKYKRAITVLDIGANLGYYSFRLSSEFDCCAVMVEGSPPYQQKLLELVEQQQSKDKLVVLGTFLDLKTLQELAKSEHFDIVLALRVVHHFQEPFQDVIDAIASLGDFVFFELPTPGEDGVRAKTRVQNELSDHEAILAKYTHRKVGEFPIHVGSTLSPLYLVENTEHTLKQPFLNSPKMVEYPIKSTFDHKELMKGDSKKEWIPGINLYTYHKLNGLYPSRRVTAELIRHYTLPENSPLTDVMPWNFILSGRKITLIDHSSIINSKGKPFNKMNPQYCLHNIALHIGWNTPNLQGVSYGQFPRTTKKQLIRRTGRELLNTVKSCLKSCVKLTRQLIDILLF